VAQPSPVAIGSKARLVDPPKPPWRWSRLESTNYATYVANLRAVDCPEQTIRDIVLADLQTTLPGPDLSVAEELTDSLLGRKSAKTRKIPIPPLSTEPLFRESQPEVVAIKNKEDEELPETEGRRLIVTQPVRRSGVLPEIPVPFPDESLPEGDRAEESTFFEEDASDLESDDDSRDEPASTTVEESDTETTKTTSPAPDLYLREAAKIGLNEEQASKVLEALITFQQKAATLLLGEQIDSAQATGLSELRGDLKAELQQITPQLELQTVTALLPFTYWKLPAAAE